ncbi:MAG: PspC domain-containing protein [Proteobacteria bacterium]|nr:PspC domain-containing protein [Pseudomonadota bacterium]
MTTYESYAPRRFSRSTDRAVLGGVCAGVADSFGFNLRVLRLLTVTAFFVAMPLTVVAYLAIVFLVPARADSRYESVRAEHKQARRQAKQQSDFAEAEAAVQVRSRCQSLEQRLANLEKHITSSSYQLDSEIRRL